MYKDNSRRQWKVLFRNILNLRILFVILFLFILLSAISPTFRSTRNIVENVLRPSAVIAIIAIGMTFVISSRGLDLSVGSIAALASAIGVLSILKLDFPIWLGILFGLLAGAIFGAFNAFFITKIKVPPFIVTFATLSIGRGLTLVFSGNLFTYGLPDKFRDLGRGSIFGIPIPIIILIILWISSLYLFNQTRLGRYARAIGANELAARVAGIEVDKYKTYFYIFIGILSALGGLISSARANVIEIQTGLGYELDAIASVIIGGTTLAGGTGSITGSVLGAIMLRLLNNGLQLIGVDTFIQKVVIGIIIIAGLAYATWRNEQSKKTARMQMAEGFQKTK